MRKGMWVTAGKSVGIITDLVVGARASARVDLVDGDGATTLTRVIGLSELRQAQYEEIPAPRRPERALAEILGYR